MTRLARTLAGLSVVVAAASAPGETKPAPPPAWPVHYGNAPEELVPFRRATPNQRYFAEQQPFLGPGRDDAAPEGLASLRIGVLAPAPYSVDGARGEMMRRGIELAVEEANAARGAGDLPFELVVREDAPLWGSAANIMVDLAFKDGVLAVIGSVDGTATHVALRVGLKAEVMLVNTASSDQTMTETNIPWLIRVFPDDRQHGYRLASIVVKEKGSKRIAVLRSNDRYARMGIRLFNDSARRLGVPIRQEMRFVPGDQAFDTAIERIRAVDPDAVVLWGEAVDAGRAAAALRRAGIKAPFFGPDRLLDPIFLKEAGEAAEGTTVTFPMRLGRTDEVWTAFERKFTKRWGKAPDYFAAYGYDGTRLTVDAIRSAGPNRFRVRDALYALRTYEGVSGPMRFDPTQNNLSPLHVYRVSGGRFVLTDLPVASR